MSKLTDSVPAIEFDAMRARAESAEKAAIKLKEDWNARVGEVWQMKAELARVQAAIAERNAAYKRREHGDIANKKCADQIEAILKGDDHATHFIEVAGARCADCEQPIPWKIVNGNCVEVVSCECQMKGFIEREKVLPLADALAVIADRLKQTGVVAEFLNQHNPPVEVRNAWKDNVYASGIHAQIFAEHAHSLGLTTEGE